jgi:UPF0042 nucleotide-binding protein
LLESFADAIVSGQATRFAETAVGIDARNAPDDLERVAPVVARLRAAGVAAEIVFLEADDEVLVQRFSETRRRHPLTDGTTSLADAIRRERQLLEPFLTNADLRIDTTRSSLHELRDLMRRRVAERPAGVMSILFPSFGFKRGVPRDADLVFDARCLPNPHWEMALRPLTGRDREVAAFLERDPRVPALLQHITGFLEAWIPCFRDEGRSYLTVAIGCTGGQHRSVYLVERLGEHFRGAQPRILVFHRELP